MTRADVLKLLFVLALIVIGGCVLTPEKMADKVKECERLGLHAEAMRIGNVVTGIQCVPK